MTVLVIHRKDASKYKNAVMIDRSTKWGNPFRLSDYGGDREVVLHKFRNWFLTNRELQDSVRAELKDKVLVCWCKPKKCHGDIYAEFLNREQLFE